MSRNISDSKLPSYGLHDRCSILGPTQTSVEWVPGVLSQWLKRSDREAQHSTQSGAEIKNM
jgi:hypothetical protein